MQFTVRNMRLCRTDNERVVQGEEQKAYFTFDASWAGCVKTAGFVRDGDVVFRAAIVNGMCLVPPAMADVPSFGVVVFRGGVRRTNPVEIAVEPNPMAAVSILPPEDLFSDLLTRVESVENRVGSGKTEQSAHQANQKNPHGVTKAQVGLANADNTADIDKPVSHAMQAALDQKADRANFYLKQEQSMVVTEVDEYYSRISNVVNYDDAFGYFLDDGIMYATHSFNASGICKITTTAYSSIGLGLYDLTDGMEVVIHCANDFGAKFFIYVAGEANGIQYQELRGNLEPGQAVVVRCEDGVLKVVGGDATKQIVLSDGTHKITFPKLSDDMPLGDAAFYNADAFERSKSIQHAAANGEFALADNAIYSVIATGDIVFSLPNGDGLSSDAVHKIEVELYLGLEYKVSFSTFGDGLLYRDGVPPVMPVGIYRLTFEYDTNIRRWCLACDEYKYDWSEALGLRADFENSVFERLQAAEGKSKGANFDAYSMYGGRKRCNVADDGAILAYEGDEAYTTDGTNGQVMVYQPAFYYKVVPLKLEETEHGIAIRKAEYYISDKPLGGFNRHPAFYDADGNEIDYILLSAFEGCVYDESDGVYILGEKGVVNDASASDFESDKLSSISGAMPIGNVSPMQCQQLAQNRGECWHIDHVLTFSLEQLLMVVEAGNFNTEKEYGVGVIVGPALPTGSLDSDSYGGRHFTYRGVESFWGNSHKAVNGIRFTNDSEMFLEKTYGSCEAKFYTIIPKSVGYISAFGYDENIDWAFVSVEWNGTSAQPVGDKPYVANVTDASKLFIMGVLGVSQRGYGLTGAFGVNSGVKVGNARLLYVPKAQKEGEA